MKCLNIALLLAVSCCLCSCSMTLLQLDGQASAPVQWTVTEIQDRTMKADGWLLRYQAQVAGCNFTISSGINSTGANTYMLDIIDQL